MASKKTSPGLGVPPNPLPTWLNLPLDSKLPMLPAPKGAVVLCTTKIGEPVYRTSSSDLDFDLSDPNVTLFSNCYRTLHDPHLKPHLTTPHMRRRLRRGHFITRDGRVICSLREFNEYRLYLRKITLAKEKRQQEQKEAGDALPYKGKMKGAAMLHGRMRDEKICEIRTRLSKQREEDRKRLLQLQKEQSERRERKLEEIKSQMTERDRRMMEKEEYRQALVRKCQAEDRAHRLAWLRRWVDDEARRVRLREQYRRARDQQRQEKLTGSWELRKRVQKEQQEAEAGRREQEEVRRKQRAAARERQIHAHYKERQELLSHLADERRARRQHLMTQYAVNFSSKISELRRVDTLNRRRRKRRRRGRTQRYSTWDLEDAILEDLQPPRLRLISCFWPTKEPSLPEHTRGQGDQSASTSGDYADKFVSMAESEKPPIEACTEPTPEEHALDEKRLSAWELYDVLQQHRIKEEDDNNLDDIEKVAKAIVDLNVFLASQVIYPAYMKYMEEDHPDLYTQYFCRPSSPTPPSDNLDEAGNPCS